MSSPENPGRFTLALEAAHEQGIVHRDLNPPNVKITPRGLVKVLDFGIATTMITPDQTTRTHDATQGGVAGTPAYMSPEQAAGRALDRRCDVWAFGCVLYECLTGTPAFQRDSVLATIAAIYEDTPAWDALPTAIRPRVEGLLERCLDRDVHNRPADLGEVLVELEAALAAGTATTAVMERRRVGHNLPTAVTRFIGRETERQEVPGLLKTTRLLTLTGPGGSGKTRLAVEVARQLVAQYAEGVWLVELAALSDPGLVPESVVTAFGLTEDKQNRPATERLDLPRFRGRVRTWVSSTLRQLSPLVVDG